MADADDVIVRLTHATGLPELLDAAYDAFEEVLELIREHDDPASELFVPMTIAAASAASGRDYVGMAPSLPPVPLGGRDCRPGAGAGPLTGSAPAERIVTICRLLVLGLAGSAAGGSSPEDRWASANAARCAQQISKSSQRAARVTDRATFGELLGLARRHLQQAAAVPGRPGDHDLLDVISSMHSLVSVLGSYLRDTVTAYQAATNKKGVAASRPAPAGSCWPSACLQARRAAVNAARELELLAGIGSPGPAASERGRHIEAAASALIAGRDLLRTHFATRQDDTVEHTSDWAPVITAHAFHRATATEMAILARHAAALGSTLLTTRSVDVIQVSHPRDALHLTCQHLRILHGSIQAANLVEPLRTEERDLIRAIPVNITPPRRPPDGTEPLPALCAGVISAAERLRHAARRAAARTARSPALNAESLRHAAAASVVTSHNCAAVLRVLASEHTDRTADSMDRAAKAAELSRNRWLAAARQLDQITSDMRGYLAAEAADARDLALWTGRLAHADPDWTPASSPHQATRGADELAAGPGGIERVAAAVHHASDALQHLAAAHQQQAWLGVRADRFLVATRSLPEDYDVARPYAPATRARATLVITAYESAHRANHQDHSSLRRRRIGRQGAKSGTQSRHRGQHR